MLRASQMDALRITAPSLRAMVPRPLPRAPRPRCALLAARRSSAVVSAAARRDPYEVLGLPRTATMADVKKAYRKKALKLHPDVNKAPDARERFMEAKNAYQEIVDREKRGSRGSNTDSSASGGRTGGWGASSASSGFGRSSAGTGRGTSSQPEEFYGLGDLVDAAQEGVERAWRALGDLFNDLEKEWSEYSKRRGREAAGPKSLWEELADIGEELVEFLEKGAGLGPDGQPTAKAKDFWSSDSDSDFSGAASGSPQGTSASRTPPPPPPQRPPPPPPPKSRKEVIDDELEALKKKMGLK